MLAIHFIHNSDSVIFASMQQAAEDRTMKFMIGQHDEFVPLKEKHGAGFISFSPSSILFRLENHLCLCTLLHSLWQQQEFY